MSTAAYIVRIVLPHCRKYIAFLRVQTRILMHYPTVAPQFGHGSATVLCWIAMVYSHQNTNN